MAEPIYKDRNRAIQLAVWKNEREVDGQMKTFYNTDITRRYTDKEGNWKDSNSFSPAELKDLGGMIAKASQEIENFQKLERESSKRVFEGTQESVEPHTPKQDMGY